MSNGSGTHNSVSTHVRLTEHSLSTHVRKRKGRGREEEGKRKGRGAGYESMHSVAFSTRETATECMLGGVR